MDAQNHSYLVTFRVNAPAVIPFEDVKEWVRFSVGDNSSISLDNPLVNEPLEPVFPSLKLERVK